MPPAGPSWRGSENYGNLYVFAHIDMCLFIDFVGLLLRLLGLCLGCLVLLLGS